MGIPDRTRRSSRITVGDISAAELCLTRSARAARCVSEGSCETAPTRTCLQGVDSAVVIEAVDVCHPAATERLHDRDHKGWSAPIWRRIHRARAGSGQSLSTHGEVLVEIANGIVTAPWQPEPCLG